MTKGMKITTPEGYQIEIDSDTLAKLSRDKLAQIMSVISNSPATTNSDKRQRITLEEIINSGKKKYWIALFLSNQYSHTVKLTTNDIHKDWTQIMVPQDYDKFFLSKSNMNEYLNRLTDDGLIQKSATKPIFWQVTEEMIEMFPSIQFNEIPTLLQSA